MRIVSVRSEKSLNQLLDKYYGGLEAADLQKLREATLEANPHLRASGAFQRGAVLVLPEVKGDLKNPATNDAADGIGAVIEELHAYARSLRNEREKRGRALAETPRLYKSAAF